jgi:hypothetical protein
MANLVNWGGHGTGAGGHNVLAYTAQFGNGLSGTLSIEDKRIKAITAGAPTFGAASIRSGMNVPSVVANLRVDQAWGSAQIMGAVQELRTNEASVPPNIDSYGYAVGGGFTWNNPSAPGSQFGITAAYAKGATAYATGSYATHNMIDAAGGTSSVGLLTDGQVIGGALHKTEIWGVNAGYQHRFSPNWAFSVHGAYNSVSHAAAANTAALCGTAGGCDFDFWSAGARALWTPVPGLDFGLDVLYHEFESQTAAGTSGATAFATKDVWSSMFRVIRNF